MSEGELDFSFPPLDLDKPYTGVPPGPIVAHVRLVAVPDRRTVQGRAPLSRTCAALVEVS